MKEYIFYDESWQDDGGWWFETYNCDTLRPDQGSCSSIEECYIEALANEGYPLYDTNRDCMYDYPLSYLEKLCKDAGIKIIIVS